MVEMFQAFPRESAIVMQRGIELGVVCNCLLVLHCAVLVHEHWDASTRIDSVLRALCLVRLALVAPRPHFWMKTWRLFVGAGCQPTPVLVAQRLVDIYAHPFAKERFLLLSYYAWLAVVSAFVWVVPPYDSPYAFSLWRHCVMSCAGIVLHRAICIMLFASLVQSRRRQQQQQSPRSGSPRRAVPASNLDSYSSKVFWTKGALQDLTARLRMARREAEDNVPPAPAVSTAAAAAVAAVSCEGSESCSICLACYALGEQLRVLRCGHYFHQRCVDTWLLQHRNCCPLCLLVVGPAAAAAG